MSESPKISASDQAQEPEVVEEKPKAEPEAAQEKPEAAPEAAQEKPKAAPETDENGKAPEAEPAKAAQDAPKAPDYYDQLIRLKAEFENFRKRTDREKVGFVRFGRASLLMKLIPIYDLLQAAHQEVQASHTDTPLAKGMEGIFKEFEKLFKEEGVTQMEPVGKPYRPMQHEVMGTVETDEHPEDTVVDVLQNGFLLKDETLRTAKVRIAKKPTKQDQQGGES